MSDETDQESKTEAATERKVRDAIEKGDVPFSREAPVFASILGLLVCLSLVVRGQAAALARDLSSFLDHPGGFSLASAEDALTLMHATGFALARFLTPILLVLTGFGLVASLAQNVPSLVSDRIAPKWNRVSPASAGDGSSAAPARSSS